MVIWVNTVIRSHQCNNFIGLQINNIKGVELKITKRQFNLCSILSTKYPTAVFVSSEV